MTQPVTICAFHKKDVRYLDMIKTFEEGISLQFPVDVCAGKNGDIYILDSGLGMVLIYDKGLMPVSSIGKAQGINNPVSLAVDDKGQVYVSEEYQGGKQKGKISVFDPLGRKKRSISFEGFPGSEGFVAMDIACDKEGKIYCAGGSSGPLIILTQDGGYIKTIQPVEETEERGKISVGITRVKLKGDLIYLLSEWQGHVYVYNRSWEKILVFGKKGGSRGKLSRGQGLAIDPEDGTTYVMDYMRHTLLIYDSSGTFMNEMGGKGWDSGWFSHPKDICIDDQGRLFVADTFNKRVQVFQTRD